ncbi:hypothetical protein [Akkermansia glycaniphila]|uniref:hypothetical protein n=1 Tax=Akkermansia glycaniphila TaxID=1679444 RepID=UPI0008DADBD8|nr:hypothetical protein [Akkermansia glycaniphila]
MNTKQLMTALGFAIVATSLASCGGGGGGGGGSEPDTVKIIPDKLVEGNYSTLKIDGYKTIRLNPGGSALIEGTNLTGEWSFNQYGAKNSGKLSAVLSSQSTRFEIAGDLAFQNKADMVTYTGIFSGTVRSQASQSDKSENVTANFTLIQR